MIRLSILFLLTFGFIKAQDFNQKIVKVPYYFDIDTITKETSLKEALAEFAVTKIVYHYSYYRLNPQFDQLKLNQDRKKELLRTYPSLQSSMIEWVDSVNYDCNSPTECEDVFHGYTIYFQNGSDLNRFEELAFADSMVRYLNKINNLRKKKSEDPKYLRSVWDDRVGWVPDTSSAFTIETEESVKSKIPSLITNTMTRNNWNNYAYVVDVTASMSMYYCDFLKNINNEFMDSNEVKICFFNDGDGKENHKKELGNTGGLFYYEGSELFKMTKVVKNHLFISSRDLQENDAEGIIRTQQKFEGVESFVLIADNHSPLRDHNLYRNITKPVHIILCGANEYNVNPQYLSLALITGGSIHVKGHDIAVPKNLSPGDTIKIGKVSYKYFGFDDYSNPYFDRVQEPKQD